MPRYKVRQVIETVKEWEVEADTHDDAEELAEVLAADKEFSEQASYEVKELPPLPVEQYWTFMGTFTMTAYGTEAQARAFVKESLGNLVDDFEIKEVY